MVVDGAAGSVDTVDFENLIDMEYAIDLGYLVGDEGGDGGFMDANGGMIGWMMHRDVERSLREQVDADSRPLWTPNLEMGRAAQGRPAMINGYPYRINQHMEAPDTNNNKPLLFGSYGHYGVRNVGGIDFYRFFDSRTVQNYQVEFIAFSRRDGRSVGPVVSTLCEAYAALQVKT